MAAWVVPAIAAAGSVLGGLMSSRASSSAANQASQDTRYAADIQKQIYDQNRADQMPFYNVGVQSLYDLAGYSPVAASPTPYQTTPAYPSVDLNAGGLPGAPTGGVTASTPFDPNNPGGGRPTTTTYSFAPKYSTGGEGEQYLNPAWQEAYLAGHTMVNGPVPVGGNAVQAQQQQQVGAAGPTMQQTGPGLDPTGGAGQYMQQLEDLSQNFQFDPENPNYKIQLEDTERAINQAYAARGMYNSRPAVNTIADNARRLSAAESERQYAKQYSSLFDLFNMSTNIGQLNYGKAIDLVKAGQGAAANMGQTGLAYGQGVSSSYGDLANIAMAEGANQSALWSGLGAMPLNYMMLQNLYGGQQTPQTGNPYMAPQ